MTSIARLHPVFFVLIASLLSLIAATGCTSDRDASTSFTVTDDLGRRVSLPRAPARVVTLAPSLTEIVYAAGAGARLAGVGLPDDYPPAVDTLPRYAVFPVDFEAIAALDPDLVLATTQINNPRDAETFAALGIPVLYFSFAELADVFSTIRRLGALLGTRRQADATADSLERRITALRSLTDAVPTRPDVLFLVGDDALYAFGAESYMHELIALAGGRSVTGDLGTVAPVLSEEFVLSRRPDLIVGSWGDDYTADRLLALHPTWDVVPAVRTGRVHGVEADVFLRPGPRLVDAAYRLTALVHPGLFSAADPAGSNR